MTERTTFYVYVLLLLICSSVAAKPINKPAKTATVHPPAAPKELRPRHPDPRMYCLAPLLRRSPLLPVQ